MTYSKIFSDLPELINKIIQCLCNDFTTLHSCIFVNRLWCRLTISLLWEDPFSIPTNNYHFIKIYLNHLNEHDKLKLNEFGIDNKLFSSNTLFNYPSFIKRLNTCKIIHSIEKWVSTVRPLTKSNHALTPLDLHPSRLIYKSLLKLFIENEVNLHTFEIMLTDQNHINITIELILQNPNFIYNIKNLSLTFGKRNNINLTKKVDSFLSLLSINCNLISSFYFRFNNNNEKVSIEKYLPQIINSQTNLKKISFDSNKFPLYNSLLSLKNSNCSNTLRTIVFFNINFNDIFILNQVFEQLNVLESVHIIYCLSLNSDFIQQIINLTKPFKLVSLFMKEILQVESFQLLLQKSGDYLENIGLLRGDELKHQLIEIIVKYCTRIRFFDLLGLDDRNIYLSFDLIKNIYQNLNYISINLDELIDQSRDEIIRLSSIVLQELGQILPIKLEYLNLSLMINTTDFEIFLKNSQNTFIKKLVIRNEMRDESKDILPQIEEYIMKKKRVKYLAMIDFIHGDFFAWKNKVKNFELYNIKVQNYDDLYIYCYNFIKEMY